MYVPYRYTDMPYSTFTSLKKNIRYLYSDNFRDKSHMQISFEERLSFFRQNFILYTALAYQIVQMIL